MTRWKPNKLWSPLGKKPIDSLKRILCCTERFWVCLPPTHPGIVAHEEDNVQQGWSNQVGKIYILGAEQHICGYSPLILSFYPEVLSEELLWIRNVNLTQAGKLHLPLPSPASQLLSPPVHLPCSTTSHPCLNLCRFTSFFILYGHPFAGSIYCIPFWVHLPTCAHRYSKYILPIFYLVFLSLGILFAFHPFYFQTHPVRESLMAKLFIQHKSSFWMHIRNVSKVSNLCSVWSDTRTYEIEENSGYQLKGKRVFILLAMTWKGTKP